MAGIAWEWLSVDGSQGKAPLALEAWAEREEKTLPEIKWACPLAEAREICPDPSISKSHGNLVTRSPSAWPMSWRLQKRIESRYSQHPDGTYLRGPQSQYTRWPESRNFIIHCASSQGMRKFIVMRCSNGWDQAGCLHALETSHERSFRPGDGDFPGFGERPGAGARDPSLYADVRNPLG